jgi:hypothetical protein
MNARSTARGIGIRALILVAGLLILGLWIASLAFKLAGAAIHLLLWVGLILIVAGAVAVVLHRIRRR